MAYGAIKLNTNIQKYSFSHFYPLHMAKRVSYCYPCGALWIFGEEKTALSRKHALNFTSVYVSFLYCFSFKLDGNYSPQIRRYHSDAGVLSLTYKYCVHLCVAQYVLPSPHSCNLCMFFN